MQWTWPRLPAVPGEPRKTRILCVDDDPATNRIHAIVLGELPDMDVVASASQAGSWSVRAFSQWSASPADLEREQASPSALHRAPRPAESELTGAVLLRSRVARRSARAFGEHRARTARLVVRRLRRRIGDGSPKRPMLTAFHVEQCRLPVD